MKDTQTPRPVIFGEVLFDCFPDGSVVLGGAPFNVAWHLQAFGMAPVFVSRVGDDALGHRIRDTMHAWEMDTSGLQLDSAHPTGKVEIRFVAGEPEYDIIDNQAYDFIDAGSLPPLQQGAVLYHGSLALRNEVSRRALEEIRRLYTPCVLVDVNLRDPWWRREGILQLLEGGSWVKLNEHELALLIQGGSGPADGMAQLLRDYGLQLLIVTRGSAGAVAVTAAGEECQIAPRSVAQVIDTVGAGDAFTSVVLLGQAYNWPLPLLLERAQQFASAIVGVRGATVNDAAFYRPFIHDWGLV
jgi:fructokinase